MVENVASAPRPERDSLFESVAAAAARVSEGRRHEVLVAISNPDTVKGLVRLGAALCRPGDRVVALKVVPVAQDASLPEAQRQAVLSRRFRDLMQLAVAQGTRAGVQIETVLHVAHDVAAGIVEVADRRPGTRLLLLGWPGAVARGFLGSDICTNVMRRASCDVLVFLNRRMSGIRRVLVPVSGGPHARLGLRLGADLAAGERADVVALRVAREATIDIAAEQAFIEDIVQGEMHNHGGGRQVLARVVQHTSVVGGILEEATQGYDMLIVGASDEGLVRNWLLGSVPRDVAEQAPCSVLLVRKREAISVSWMRRTWRRFWGLRRR